MSSPARYAMQPIPPQPGSSQELAQRLINLGVEARNAESLSGHLWGKEGLANVQELAQRLINLGVEARNAESLAGHLWGEEKVFVPEPGGFINPALSDEVRSSITREEVQGRADRSRPTIGNLSEDDEAAVLLGRAKEGKFYNPALSDEEKLHIVGALEKNKKKSAISREAREAAATKAVEDEGARTQPKSKRLTEALEPFASGGAGSLAEALRAKVQKSREAAAAKAVEAEK